MIIPAIDLMDGHCVRLFQGKFNDKTVYEDDPRDVARSYARSGAEWVHVVDLDGAKNQAAAQLPLIAELADTVGIKVQAGGGIRDLSTVKQLLDSGVERVIIGSLAVKRPIMVRHWIDEFGPERIALAFDVNIDDNGVAYPAIKGWTETVETPFFEILDGYAQSGLKTILVTDIGRDGVGAGSNTILYRKIQMNYPTLNLMTSGGVGNLDHVRELKDCNPYGIVIGKALYEGHFSLAEAIAC